MFGHGGTDKQIDSEKISILLYVVGSLLEVVGPPAILIDLGVVSCLTKPHGDVTRHSLCK